LIDALILFGIFVLAGATSFQFYRGRKKNLQLMIDYVRELERGLNPIDKNYTMLGLYSGFKADYVLGGRPRKVVATLGLMPRESLWYYPISMLTLKHDRLYLVYYLETKKLPKLHLLKPQVLKYKGIDLDKRELKEITIDNEKYLFYSTDENALKRAVALVREVPDLLHIAITPETGVLYFFAKPKVGAVERLAREGLNWAKELIKSERA
jgi:hypothetical protein